MCLKSTEAHLGVLRAEFGMHFENLSRDLAPINVFFKTKYSFEKSWRLRYNDVLCFPCAVIH